MPDENSICFDAVAVSAFGETFGYSVSESRAFTRREASPADHGARGLR
jgi:hypothetical protein